MFQLLPTAFPRFPGIMSYEKGAELHREGGMAEAWDFPNASLLLLSLPWIHFHLRFLKETKTKTQRLNKCML